MKDIMNDTVVYRHRKPCGEVFYIGIGNKKRPTSKKDRNKFWHHIVKKHGYDVEVIAEGLSWADACELEEFLISIYGRRDLGTGTLVNLTNGGEGAKGITYKHSVESRKKISEAKKGKKQSLKHIKNRIESFKGYKHSVKSIKKMSEAKKGKKFSAEHRKKISKAHKGMPQKKVTCPHCKKEGGITNMKRYHFDNCKHKEA